MSNQREPRAVAPTVGVLGVGNMGKPMTLNLLASARARSVRVYGRTRSRLTEVEAAGALPSDTPRQLAAASEVLLSMLPDLPELRRLFDGANGILAGISSPTVLVIGSTSSPGEVRELRDELDDRTGGLLHVVDAPVSGGTDGAAAGTLSIMCGADPADYALVEHVLGAMGTPVLLGPLGSGEIAKACNQMIVASTMLALSEATVIAERAGLDVTKLLDLFSGGYAGSRLLDSRKQRLIDKDYSVSGPAKFMVKDLGFARDEAERTATATPQLTMLQHVFAGLVDAGLGDEDLSVVQAFVSSLPRATGESPTS
ncbi:MAG TPA: NAD(P)-dependent oxidoreductase [Humibacter sp.]|nr:NAD(P)-dependent oxidoreductase [Humibacter sp.]